MAKELVRLRQQSEKLKQTKTTLKCVSNRATVRDILLYISIEQFASQTDKSHYISPREPQFQ
jgi:hypothetical protein